MSMLNKLFPKPVQFTIEGQELTFNTIADFEFCLSGRTSVPVKKIAELMKLPPHKLHKEASTIKEIEKKFVAILSRAIENCANWTPIYFLWITAGGKFSLPAITVVMN
jgi:hypothetical protein